MPKPRSPELIKGLGVYGATSVVAGTMIGTAIFVVPSIMLREVGTPALVLAVWVAAGILSLFGALGYAELGAALPEAGGEFVYLHRAYGPLFGFLYGWTQFIVAKTASIAAIAFGLVIYLAYFFPRLQETLWAASLDWGGHAFAVRITGLQLGSALMVLALSGLNVLGVRGSGAVQTIFTAAKLLVLAILIGLGFAMGHGSWDNFRPFLATAHPGGSLFAAFGIATVSALWAYDGWNNVSMVGGEVENPERNLPIALIAGSLLVLTVYVVVNVAYFYVLPASQILHTSTVASDAARSFLGHAGGDFIAVGVIVSTFATLNGSILAGSRIPYATARAGLFPGWLAAIHPRFHTPVLSLGGQAIIAALFAVTGEYESLYTKVIFAEFLFYALCTLGIFVLRYRCPDLPRPYRTWGYPVVPALFIVLSIFLLVNTFREQKADSMWGLVMVGSGIPAYSLENLEAPIDMKCRASSLIRTALGVMLIAPWTAAGQKPPVAAPPANLAWTVVSTPELDARLQRQLEQMAADDQATISYAKSAPAEVGAARPPGSLVIELRQENAETFRDTLQRAAQQTAIAPELTRLGYVAEATYPEAAAPTLLRITAGSTEGFHNALLRVPDLLRVRPVALANTLIPHPQSVRVERGGASVIIADFPSLPERGVVEGFYGVPWTQQDRLDILRFEGAHSMNVYYYAPKDDPYHRRLWRKPYPYAEGKRLGELVETANRNLVDFCFAISPGQTIAYSNEQDFQVLVDKLASVGKLGVSCFALFLDDVPQALENPQDKLQFKTLAQAHIFLTNKLYRRLKEQSASNRLVLTPTTYTSEWGSRDYIKELGAGVDPQVSIVWTGPKVFSPTITVEQAREWGGFLERKPLLWDNYPVNDAAPWDRYLGPLIGRSANLPSELRGYFSNPMNQARASMIPLQTVADYLWNSAAYDPAQSETHAVESQYGNEAPRLLAPFLQDYGSYDWEEGVFTPLFRERRYPIHMASIESQLAELNATLERLGNQQRLQPLLAEMAPAVKRAGERLPQVNADPAFRHLATGELQWDENYDGLSAYHLAQSPKLDGDFSKWRSGPVYRLNQASQLSAGVHRWKGPSELSARVALAWDASFLYVGVDVTEPNLYQPFFARGIQNGDTFVLSLETGFRKNYFATQATGDEYVLFFSPGNFKGVQPSIFSDEDYLPPRAQPANYWENFVTAWKKTARGYSGDIAIPVTLFEGGKFTPGYEIGLGFSVRKVLRPAKPAREEDLQRITLQSKKDRLFHISPRNPSSFPRLVLAGTP